MTGSYAEADPAPEQPWCEASSPGIRRLALQAAAEAVRKSKERTQPAKEPS